jgi:hypothetical protein
MFEITDDKFKKKIMCLFSSLWSSKYSNFFPNQICDYIERKDLFKLKNFLYYYYKKNTKYEKKAFLFLFTDSNCENRAVLIVKNFTIYLLDINCQEDYYKNSLFDVTISGDNKIIIYDTIYISGIKINNYTFIDRITEAENFKKNTNTPAFDICEYLEEINNLNETLKPFEEEIFIISNNLPIKIGINRGCFKWQPLEFIYFSLKVIEHEYGLLLYISNYKKDLPFAKIHESDPDGKDYITQIKNLEKYTNECIIDICFNKNIKILRVSENFPSSLRHVEKLLHIKNENITIHELVN